ncbi:chromate resistance protein ChrB domain-containing protein [Gracilibacillus dipsosauri]
MKWVTWENVGVDSMACAWLVKKWIDPEAEFFICSKMSEAITRRDRTI